VAGDLRLRVEGLLGVVAFKSLQVSKQRRQRRAVVVVAVATGGGQGRRRATPELGAERVDAGQLFGGAVDQGVEGGGRHGAKPIPPGGSWRGSPARRGDAYHRGVVRVFVDPAAIRDGRLRLDGADARHVGGSLRIRPGEELVAVTPDRVEHLCKVVSASPGEVLADVVSAGPSRREPSIDIRLCVALLKGDQLDRILEYAGELGVGSVQPLLTERTVARPDAAKLAGRLERWQQILRHGAELGQRGRLPEALPATDLTAAVAATVAAGMDTFLLYEGSGLPSLSVAKLGGGGVCLVVGPEGGWSEAEVMLAEQSGATAVTLGPRIMRPLPAALTALAVVMHRAGELELKED
ncbi:MAG: rRNA (uracil1498-N3)-methyltransferase, partial [Chloroflexota bacterium]|nr:rRNA (uracil1498-N3)-methyltransferase [Chloroflexota bacterium]